MTQRSTGAKPPVFPLDRQFYSEGLQRNVTLRGYFKQLLHALWKEQDNFSGECPFGDSGWNWQLASDLNRAGGFNVPGRVNEYGDFEPNRQFDAVIYETINQM